MSEQYGPSSPEYGPASPEYGPTSPECSPAFPKYIPTPLPRYPSDPRSSSPENIPSPKCSPPSSPRYILPSPQYSPISALDAPRRSSPSLQIQSPQPPQPSQTEVSSSSSSSDWWQNSPVNKVNLTRKQQKPKPQSPETPSDNSALWSDIFKHYEKRYPKEFLSLSYLKLSCTPYECKLCKKTKIGGKNAAKKPLSAGQKGAAMGHYRGKKHAKLLKEEFEAWNKKTQQQQKPKQHSPETTASKSTLTKALPVVLEQTSSSIIARPATPQRIKSEPDEQPQSSKSGIAQPQRPEQQPQPSCSTKPQPQMFQQHTNDMDTSNPQQNEDDRKIFAGGLAQEATEKDIAEYFSKFGEVIVYIFYNMK